MINISNISNKKPYQKFKDFYLNALKSEQLNIDAVCISSFSNSKREVNSRFVNLKIVDGEQFIFFSNYKSPKGIEFQEHDQISAAIFWNKVNVQIRIKANIKKITKEFNKIYFMNRDIKKNALAISSNQSEVVDSFDDVINNYKTALKTANLKDCPDYWGGYEFTPYSIEFWEGDENRLNKRELYTKNQINDWSKIIIQP